MIERLTELFSWSAPDALLDELAERHVQEMIRRLGRTVGRLAVLDPRAADALRNRLRGLPDPVLRRVLTAPRTCQHLSYSEEGAIQGTADFLHAALDAEERLRGGRIMEAGGWTALCDWYFPPGAPAEAATVEGDVWDPGRVYRTPALDNGVLVDWQSPFACGPLPEIAGGLEPFPRAEVAATVARLQQAMRGLRLVSEAGSHAVERFVKAVVMRSDPTIAHFTPASSQLTVGLVVLRNPHIPQADTAELLGGVLHETVHVLADIIQFESPFFPPDQAVAARRLPSPWTGRSLDLDTYIQACLVWYALWKFWFTVIDHEVMDRRVVLAHMARACAGFRRADAIAPLEEMAQVLAPGLLGQLHVAQEQVRQESALVQRALESLGSG